MQIWWRNSLRTFEHLICTYAHFHTCTYSSVLSELLRIT